MKNKLSDLNNHLFSQLERLSDEDLTAEQLQVEISRSKAVTDVATTIVQNAKLVFEAQKEFGDKKNLPEVLGIGSDKPVIGDK
jgi:hypothetical protein